jgi:hypothetical protein
MGAQNRDGPPAGWELQQAILDRSAPIAGALGDDDAVVTDVPLQTDGVRVFRRTMGRHRHGARAHRPDPAHRFGNV